MLPPDRSQTIQQPNFICFIYGKALGKQAQAIKEHWDKQIEIKDQRIKHVEALESLRFVRSNYHS